jgi:hypothetical protein
MARPKSLKPTKNQLKAVRLTKDDLVKIKTLYGSLQKWIDLMIKVLPVLLFISCGGGAGGGAASSSAGTTSGSNTTGNIYAKAVSIQKEYSLGYDLSYSCSGNTCSFSGEFHHYRYNNNDITKTQITTAELTQSGSDYVGIIYLSSGQQFNASIRIGQNFIKIDNGTYCTRSQSATTQSGYDAFLSGVTVNDGSLQFNALTIGQCEL